MLSLEQKYPRFPQQFAQSSGELQLSEVESSPVELNTIALSDNTRLGPYSWLLKDAFEESQTEQVLRLNESDQTADLVALGRSLTPEEQSQGLRQQLVTREKIALIVSADNPFQGTLTLQQVTQIFNGEITNWQQVGGEDLPLQLVNRPQKNLTRQSLAGYRIFDQAQFDANAVQANLDTTADIVAALGNTGLSYSPASEAIEQFSMRIIPIDNVGVDDGRYPFSQSLYYVYSNDPSENVQGFLDFLDTPDAESAIEFAQSQPADPARASTEPALAPLKTNTQSNPQNPSDSTQPAAIPAAPLDPTPTSETLTEAPGVETTNPATPVPEVSRDPWSGLPLLLIFVALGVLGWLAFMRVQLAKKRKQVPRPAPNYAERLKSQGSNRDIDELKAILRDPKLKEEEESRASEVLPPIVPDLSLGDEVDTEDVFVTNRSDVENVSTDSSPFWDEDLTTLQAAPTQTPEAELDLDDLTTIQRMTDDAEELAVESSPAEPLLSLDSISDAQTPEAEFDLDDLTTIQRVTDDAEGVAVESSPADPLPSLDSISDEETDVTLVQGVFQTHFMEPEEDEDLTDATIIQGGGQIDPLTGRVIEEQESLPEQNIAEEIIPEENIAEEVRLKDESTAAETQTRDNSSPSWNEVSDPWE